MLTAEQIAPSALPQVVDFHAYIVAEVDAARQKHAVLVVGMKQNPFPKRARKALAAAGIPFHYVEYGSYLSAWRPRLAIKMYTGFPTFPQIFVHGVLIGGATDLEKALADGSLQERLAAGGAG